MFSEISNCIKVTVQPEYDARNSLPAANRFTFRYYVTIENHGYNTIQLLSREWLIYDSGAGMSTVAGEGVIGLLPEISPAGCFTYFSNVTLHSGIGYMRGKYFVKNLATAEIVEIIIPRFDLVSPIFSN